MEILTFILGLFIGVVAGAYLYQKFEGSIAHHFDMIRADITAMKTGLHNKLDSVKGDVAEVATTVADVKTTVEKDTNKPA